MLYFWLIPIALASVILTAAFLTRSKRSHHVDYQQPDKSGVQQDQSDLRS